MKTVQSLLLAARAQGHAEVDARMLLLHVLARPPHDRAWLLAHGDQVVQPALVERWQALLKLRADDVPVAYLVGQREFYGLALEITSDVLDPRPDTEILVDWALEGLAAAPARVLDLGTGSGAIILAIKHARPDLAAHASERNPKALVLARANARKLGLDITWHAVEAGQGWLQGLGALPAFDLIVSNPPYLDKHDAHLQALRHEPQDALIAPGEGLADLRAIAKDAREHLKPGARLILEHGWSQAGAVRESLASLGYHAIETRRDLAGHERCTGAIWDNPSPASKA